jgi:hypothetical protein
MTSPKISPKWWQLYLTFPFLIALFVMDSRLGISIRGHQAVQIGTILLVYGSIHWWLKANRSALLHMEMKQSNRPFRVIEIPPVESPELGYGKRSVLQLSDSEIRGLLSDGMEMSYIDSELFSNKDIHKN